MTKEPCFVTFRGVWTCLLTLSRRTTPFGGFTEYFRVAIFWTLPDGFREKKPLGPLGFALNFT